MSNHKDNPFNPFSTSNTALQENMKALFKQMTGTIGDISEETLERIEEYRKNKPLDLEEAEKFANDMLLRIIKKAEEGGNTEVHQYLTDLQKRYNSQEILSKCSEYLTNLQKLSAGLVPDTKNNKDKPKVEPRGKP